MHRLSALKRREVAVLAVALVGVIVLAGVLLVRDRATALSTSSKVYPQITQSPPTLAVPTVAFIGDSYSAGTGSSGYDSRFTTLVAAYEGWSPRNFAYGGTGYSRSATPSARTGCGSESCPVYREVIDRVRAYDPNIVVVSGGRNDVGAPQAAVDAAIDRFYRELRAALPKAQIVVSSPVWAYSSPPQQLRRIQSKVEEAATSVGATYLDIGEPLADRSLVGNDRVHPNDRGHAEMARTIEVALSEAQKAAASPSPSASSTTVP